ncbi:MAG TPA: hypothetical protein PKZ26_04785 [Anaerolineaceae bacterium]|mgnify:FL=1|jgi:hypothetical protein|nr:hypothetical protein [Chloroflexota bacterium]HUM62969.1 hypothetical protein [Anaerolineaceae bacterium]
MKRFSSFSVLLQLGIFLLGVSGSIYVAFTPANSMMNWYSNDDAFYYYKVAQNVLSGHGFSFDGINLTNGFHPLWMVICLGVFWLSRFHLLLPLRVLIVISGVLNGLTGVVLLRLLQKFLPLVAAILGACVWILLPSIYNNYTAHGLESALSAFFVAVLLLKSADLLTGPAEKRAGKLIILGIIAALTILSRLDTLFVVAMVGFFVVFKITRMNRLMVFDLVAVFIASVLAWIIRFSTTPLVLNNYSLYPQMVLSLMLTPTAVFFAGLYNPKVKYSKVQLFSRLAAAAAGLAAALYLALLLLQKAGMNLLVSRSLILLSVSLAFILFLFVRFFYRPSSQVLSVSAWQQVKNWIQQGLPHHLRDGALFSFPIVLLVCGYMLTNKLVFGTFTPVSGQVKTWWGTLENTVYRQNTTLVGLMGLAPGRGKSPWSLLTSIVADISIFIRNLFVKDTEDLPVILFLVFLFMLFILLIFLLSRKDGLLARRSFALLIPALAGGCLLHIAYYAARNYGHTRSWYWVPETMLLVLLGAVVSSRMFEKTRQWTRTPVAENLLLLVMVGFVFFLHARYIARLCPPSVSPEHQADYLAETRELESYTRENSLIGMTGGGATAYFIQNRTIINLDGLINSAEYFSTLKTGATNRFLNNLHLDYVFGNSYMLLKTDPYQQIFTGRIREIGNIHSGSHFTLYDYIGDQ